MQYFRAHAVRTIIGSATIATIALALTACGADGDAGQVSSDTVTLVTHDSFGVSDEVLAEFEAKSGLTVKQVAPGDGGVLVNQLVLTKDAPLGDAVFGIDNSFATRARKAGVLDDYAPKGRPASAAMYDVGSDLTPVDVGDVCVNVDHAWFTAHNVAEPATLDDLAEPQYKDLLVVTNPATSSPGLSFLLATIDAYGEGWPAYWGKLADNGVKVTDSWADAYGVDFSGGEGQGTRPLVVSYSTSPAFTVSDDGKSSTTGALLDTCFRQVEYAGVLANAKNPEGARQLVDFLVSRTFQEDIPGSMYMYPVDDGAKLPQEWATFAPLSPKPFTVSPDRIASNRDQWIEQWTTTVVG